MGAAVGPTPPFIPDILEEHLEELAFLWTQRTNALRSPDYTLREIGFLEERIEAHAQGLLGVGDAVIPFVEEALTEGDPNVVFAGAYTLLRLGTDSSLKRVLDALAMAKGPQLDGLRTALCHAPVDRILPELKRLFHSAPASVAAAAAEALAFHSALLPTAERILHFLRDDAPGVRQGGWRLVSYLAVPVDAKTYAAAIRDDDPAVRNAAFAAAAWSGQQAILSVGRQLAVTPVPDHLAALHLLATLGDSDDLQRIAAIGMTKAMGPARFDLVASYGHPALVDLLLVEIGGADPESASAAGEAFARVTGQNVDSATRSTVPPKDGKEQDEFDEAFQDEVTLPDYAVAYHHWQRMKPQVATVARLCRGLDVARGLTAESFAALDMRSRWEICLRGRFHGTWPGSPVHLEVFPQSR